MFNFFRLFEQLISRFQINVQKKTASVEKKSHLSLIKKIKKVFVEKPFQKHIAFLFFGDF